MEKNKALSVVSIIYGLIPLIITLAEINYALDCITGFEVSKDDILLLCVNLLYPFIFIVIAFILSIFWYKKKKYLASKICMYLILISIIMYIGLFIYLLI